MQRAYFVVMTVLVFAQVLMAYEHQEHHGEARTVLLRPVVVLVENQLCQPVKVTVMSKVAWQQAFYRYELPGSVDSQSTMVLDRWQDEGQERHGVRNRVRRAGVNIA